MEKLEWSGYPTVKNFDDMFSRFDTIPACDRQTVLVHAMHTLRAVKIEVSPKQPLGTETEHPPPLIEGWLQAWHLSSHLSHRHHCQHPRPSTRLRYCIETA